MLRTPLYLVGLIGGIAISLVAQTFGELSGTVLDRSQGAVATARVRVLSLSTGQNRTTETSESGTYRVPLLPPGAYEVTAEKEGFKKSTIRGVEIQLDVATRLD